MEKGKITIKIDGKVFKEDEVTITTSKEYEKKSDGWDNLIREFRERQVSYSGLYFHLPIDFNSLDDPLKEKIREFVSDLLTKQTKTQ